jgi:hypothetical protein
VRSASTVALLRPRRERPCHHPAKPCDGLEREKSRAAYIKAWREKHREHRRAYNKQWREENREQHNATNKRWREENRDHINKTRRKRRRVRKEAKQAAE